MWLVQTDVTLADHAVTLSSKKQPFLKRISDGMLSDVCQEKCKQYFSYVPYVFTALYATLGLISFGTMPLLKIIPIGTLVILQIIINKFFNYRLATVENQKDKLIDDLQDKLSCLLFIEKRYAYQKRLCMECLSLIDALNEMKVSCDVKAFYTKLLFSIKEMTKYVSGIPNENLAFHLYAYDMCNKTVKRVAGQNSVNSLQSSDEKKTVSIENVRKYFYAKCLKNESKTLFFLKDNPAIRQKFYFKDADEAIKRQYTQYIAVTYRGKGSFRFLVEIISYNGVKLYEAPEDFIDQVVAPFSSIFKLIDIEKDQDSETMS